MDFLDKPFWKPSRLLSALVVVVYGVVAHVAWGGESSAKAVMMSLPPMLCIWFPDVLGEHDGSWPSFRRHYWRPTPGVMVSFMGWVLLLLPLLVLYLGRA